MLHLSYKKSFSYIFLKSVSGFLVTAFLCQDLVFANPEPNLSLATAPLPAFRALLPENMAKIEETFHGNGKTIYLIQDAHTNPSAQINIAGALQVLIEKEAIRTVYLEGGFGDVSLTSFKHAAGSQHPASLQNRVNIGMKYLRKGELSGAEYLNLVSDGDFKLWGAEDENLYWKSLEAYRSVAKERARFTEYLSQIRRTVEELKPEILNPAPRAFDSVREKFLGNKISYTGYFSYLDRRAQWFGIPPGLYPEWGRLRRLKKREESIDFVRADDEAVRACRALPEEAFRDLKENVSRHHAGKFSTKDQKTAVAFYLALEEKLSTQGGKNQSLFNAAQYPNLFRYFSYLKEADKLNPSKLLDEQKTLEREIIRFLFLNDREKRLLGISDTVRDLESLLDLAIPPDAYEKIGQNPAMYDIREITGFLNRQIMSLEDHYDRTIFLKPDFEKVVQNAKEFYRLTQERDSVFISSLLREMEKNGESKAVLVAGGYHSPNLKTLLKRNGLSYVSILPQVMNETNTARYEKLLLGQAQWTGSGGTEKDSIAILALKSRLADSVSPVGPKIFSEELILDGNYKAVDAAVAADRKSAARLAKKDNLVGALAYEYRRYQDNLRLIEIALNANLKDNKNYRNQRLANENNRNLFLETVDKMATIEVSVAGIEKEKAELIYRQELVFNQSISGSLYEKKERETKKNINHKEQEMLVLLKELKLLTGLAKFIEKSRATGEFFKKQLEAERRRLSGSRLVVSYPFKSTDIKDIPDFLSIRDEHVWVVFPGEKIGLRVDASKEVKGRFYVKTFYKDGNSWAKLGSLYFELHPKNRQFVIGDFYPYGHKGNDSSDFANSGVAQMIVAWLSLVALKNGYTMYNSGTSSAKLIHIYEKLFATHIKIRSERMPISELRRKTGFYSYSNVGAIFLEGRAGRSDSLALLFNPKKHSYVVDKSSLLSGFAAGTVLRINDKGIIFDSSGHRTGYAVDRFRNELKVWGPPKKASIDKVFDEWKNRAMKDAKASRPNTGARLTKTGDGKTENRHSRENFFKIIWQNKFLHSRPMISLRKLTQLIENRLPAFEIKFKYPNGSDFILPEKGNIGDDRRVIQSGEKITVIVSGPSRKQIRMVLKLYRQFFKDSYYNDTALSQSQDKPDPGHGYPEGRYHWFEEKLVKINSKTPHIKTPNGVRLAKARLQGFMLGIFLAFGAAVSGEAFAMDMSVSGPVSVFEVHVQKQAIEVTQDSQNTFTVQNFPEAAERWKTRQTGRMNRKRQELAVRSALRERAQRVRESLPIKENIRFKGFVKVDLSEFSGQILAEEEFQDAVRLLFEVLAGHGGNYFLDGLDNLPDSRKNFVKARLVEMKGPANVTLAEPEGMIVEFHLMESGYEALSLGSNKLAVEADGYGQGLTDLNGGLRIAEELAGLASRHTGKNGSLPAGNEEARSLEEDLARSPIGVALEQLSDYHGRRLSGREMLEYFRLKLDPEKASQLLIRPIRIFVELGKALKQALWTGASA